MKYFLLLLISSFSFGDNSLTETNVIFSPIEKVLHSLVRIVIEDPRNNLNTKKQPTPPHLLETIGFIAKNSKGDIGIIASFDIFDLAVHIDMEKFLMVYNSKGYKFAIKEVKTISPENSLIFFTVKGDLTENGDIPPLPLASFRTNKEPAFYTSKVLSGNNLRLKIKKVQQTVSLANRLDFLVFDMYTKGTQPDETFTPVLNQTPIFNQKGEIVSFVSDGSQYTLYGIPLQALKKILNSSEYCSPFIRGCVIEARRKLHNKARAQNRKAIYALISLTYEFEIEDSEAENSFEDFMHSIHIRDSGKINREKQIFWEKAIDWNADLYHRWLTGDDSLSKSNKKKHLELLAQASSFKSLAKQGHPHFQYLLADVYFQLNNEEQALYWLNKADKSGYIPAKTMLSRYEENNSSKRSPSSPNLTSEQLNQQCEEVFDDIHLISGNQ